MEDHQLREWIVQLKFVKEQIFKSMYDEMLSNIDCTLVERHVKQVQYECRYLSQTLYKYENVPDRAEDLYVAIGVCLEEILEHIETRYSLFFNWNKDAALSAVKNQEIQRIRVLFSVDALAYFFKLLNKAGGLDAIPSTQLMKAISQNFITPGVGIGYISPKSLASKYKQVVQSTGLSVRKLLTRMLQHLNEEFTV